MPEIALTSLHSCVAMSTVVSACVVLWTWVNINIRRKKENAQNCIEMFCFVITESLIYIIQFSLGLVSKTWFIWVFIMLNNI